MISEKPSTDSRRMLQNGVPQFVGFCRCTPCRQRRGKAASHPTNVPCTRMHPVQAAPRQRSIARCLTLAGLDAPRAGSAEAKGDDLRKRRGEDDAPRAGSAEAKTQHRKYGYHVIRCTPCRQRRGKERRDHTVSHLARCTPCRQRRGKAQVPCACIAEIWIIVQ